MTIFLLICIIGLSIALIWVLYCYRQDTRRNRQYRLDMVDRAADLAMANMELKEKYNALEQGMDEQQDNFDQQLASFDEILTERNELLVEKRNRNNYIFELEDEVERHRRNCLPDLSRADSIDA